MTRVLRSTLKIAHDVFVHKFFRFLKIAKNVKFKKFCLSPHVANGDKAGQRWFREILLQNSGNATFLPTTHVRSVI